MRKHRFLSVFSKPVLMMTLLLSGYAGAVVNSTQSRLVFNENSLAETLVLVNSEKAPALVQVWSDDNDPLALPESINTPLVVVPPLFKLEPGSPAICASCSPRVRKLRPVASACTG
jgi:P pilus assembly chaperone PapD